MKARAGSSEDGSAMMNEPPFEYVPPLEVAEEHRPCIVVSGAAARSSARPSLRGECIASDDEELAV